MRCWVLMQRFANLQQALGERHRRNKTSQTSRKNRWVHSERSFKGKWSEWRDSNSRPSGPKPDALPGCATLRRCFHIPPDTEFQAFILCKIRFILLFLRTSRIYRRCDWQMQPRQRPKPKARRLAAANFQNILRRFLRFASCQTKRFSIGNYVTSLPSLAKNSISRLMGVFFIQNERGASLANMNNIPVPAAKGGLNIRP